MSLFLIVFIVVAVLLVALLAWAVRPPKRTVVSPDDIIERLSEKRHYARLPQILQCLRPEDTDFLHTRGYDNLVARVRRERKRIALVYLQYLEEEYQLLLDATRVLAKVAPEVSAMDEFQRFRLNLRFVLYCRYLRWRLHLGLSPWTIFGILGDMEGDMTLRLEAATTSIGERAAIASEFPLFLQDRGRGSQ
jgi:hypothetical protein